MNSDRQFLTGPGHLSRTIAKAVEKLGATLVNYTEPRGERRHWFCCPNLNTSDKIECDVKALLPDIATNPYSKMARESNEAP